jgi:hypothetical protein
LLVPADDECVHVTDRLAVDGAHLAVAADLDLALRDVIPTFVSPVIG